MQKVVLSSSPLCNYSIPYLLTDEGKGCPTRQYISEHIYSSKHLLEGECVEDEEVVEKEEEEGGRMLSDQVLMKPPHPFIDPSVLINCVDNKENLQAILNDFRAQVSEWITKCIKVY